MADVIKKIKIKQSDGIYSDYIPIGSDTKNITHNDTNLETLINGILYQSKTNSDNIQALQALPNLQISTSKNGEDIILSWYKAGIRIIIGNRSFKKKSTIPSGDNVSIPVQSTETLYTISFDNGFVEKPFVICSLSDPGNGKTTGTSMIGARSITVEKFDLVLKLISSDAVTAFDQTSTTFIVIGKIGVIK